MRVFTEIKQLTLTILFIALLFTLFALSCKEAPTGLHKVSWKECTHLGTPIIQEGFDQYAGMEIVLTEASRYLSPCDCDPSDYTDWNKLGGFRWSIYSDKNSILLAWVYRDGKHLLAPYLHDDWQGNELNPHFCDLPIIEAQEGISYYFLVHQEDSVRFALTDDSFLFGMTLFNRAEFECRPGYFTFSHGDFVNAWFGGQCKSPGNSFYRRILSEEEVKYRFSQL